VGHVGAPGQREPVAAEWRLFGPVGTVDNHDDPFSRSPQVVWCDPDARVTCIDATRGASGAIVAHADMSSVASRAAGGHPESADLFGLRLRDVPGRRDISHWGVWAICAPRPQSDRASPRSRPMPPGEPPGWPGRSSSGSRSGRVAGEAGLSPGAYGRSI